MDVKQEAIRAESRIRGFIRETPLEYSPYLSRMCDCAAYLKLENLQLTGSFKLRGAANKILSLGKTKRKKGLITASSGNHGMAFAHLMKELRLKGTIFLPETASPTKIEALRMYGTEIVLFGDDCIKAEILARETADNKGITYVSPYNDPLIVAGQATIAIELTRQLDKMDAVLIPVGGGGLISGVGGYLKKSMNNIEIVGCQPQNSAVMYNSIKADKIVEMESFPTISDGTAGGIEPGAITLPLCQRYVDDFVLLPEEDIVDAIKLIIEKHFLLIEGAAALPVAALIKNKKVYRGKNVVLILSGAKISIAKLKEILN